MKTLNLSFKLSAFFAALFLFALVSCQKEGSLSSTDTVAVTEEEAVTYSDESTQAEASFDDVEDVSMLAADEEGETSLNGRGTETNRLFPFVELRPRLGPCANTVSRTTAPIPKPLLLILDRLVAFVQMAKFAAVPL